MPWRLFHELSMDQAVVAQRQVREREDAAMLKLSQREFLVVDGKVVGSRTHARSPGARAVAGLSFEPDTRGSLRHWTGGPPRWSLP